MPGLVDREFTAVRGADRGQQSPPLIGDILRDYRSLGLELDQRAPDVVAHQVELLAALPVGGMNGQLGRREGENRPASARVHRRQPEHVREEPPDLLRFWREHNRMYPSDHPSILSLAGQRLRGLLDDGRQIVAARLTVKWAPAVGQQLAYHRHAARRDRTGLY